MSAETALILNALLLGIVAGGLAGIMAGLAGVGGGMIYVPLFYIAMPVESEGMALHIFASLMAVAMTGVFSSRSHWRLRHVDISALRKLLPGLIAGACLGLWFTLHVDELWVLMGLSLLYAWVAYDYGRMPERGSDTPISLPLLSAPIGYLSGSLGIGGGTMLVPLLRRSMMLRFAVGTSALCGAVMALVAVLINGVLEEQWRTLLAQYFPILAAVWLGVLLAMPKASAWAARLHQQVDEVWMRLLLKSLFALLSVMLLLTAFIA